MYYTGMDPRNMQPVYVPRSPHEKAMQRALIQYRNPELYDLVHEALVKAGRTDLIGYGPKCLIRPRKTPGAAGKSAGAGRGLAEKGEKGRPKTSKKKKTIRNVHRKKH